MAQRGVEKHVCCNHRAASRHRRRRMYCTALGTLHGSLLRESLRSFLIYIEEVYAGQVDVNERQYWVARVQVGLRVVAISGLRNGKLFYVRAPVRYYEHMNNRSTFKCLLPKITCSKIHYGGSLASNRLAGPPKLLTHESHHCVLIY